MKVGAAVSFFLASVLKVAMSQSEDNRADASPRAPPSMNGTHLRVTVVEEEGWVNIEEDPEDGSFTVSGYSIDILKAVAKRANFTYDLLPPSGYGSLCNHPKASNGSVIFPTQPYLPHYRGQYLCAQSDVQDNAMTRNDNYTTDLYQGIFYVTPERHLYNRFSIPFLPPTLGGLQLFGIATHIRDIYDLIQQQQEDKQKPVCLQANTAYVEWVKKSLPQLQTIEVDLWNASQYYERLKDGTCETFLQSYPVNTRMILQLSRRKSCQIGPQKKPIGIIGDVLPFGYSQFAIGIRMDLPHSVDDTINYWMNKLMSCSPIDESCDSFSSYYFDVGGTGHECGYIAYPPTEKQKNGAIVGIVLGITLVVLVIGWFIKKHLKLLRRRRKVKHRFVQQVARNVDIGKSPTDIPTEKLARLFDYIDGDKKGCITEKDFRFWMADLNLEFLSEDELTYLYRLMEAKKPGAITTMEFMAFLKTCSREFIMVSSEVQNFSKTERMKFKSRDFDILLCENGEEQSRKLEYEVNKHARQNIHAVSSRTSADSSSVATNGRASYETHGA